MLATLHRIHAVTAEPDAPAPPRPAAFSPFAAITATLVRPLFPFTPLANIAANLPHVLSALAAANLTDPPMLLAALATIRAEAEPFLPLTEAESPFNTSPGGQPFCLYDHRADLGNQGPPDGAAFRGRGYVQLTGRFNYTHYARTLSLPLLDQPASPPSLSPPRASSRLSLVTDRPSSAWRSPPTTSPAPAASSTAAPTASTASPPPTPPA
jgi:hypothetical protein